MHEASLMRTLMRRIDQVAAEEKARKVVGVHVWLGALSHMSPAHFAEHFEHAAAGGIAAGARLRTELSSDPEHVHAQDIRLLSIEVEE